MLSLLKQSDIELAVITCDTADESFISDLKRLEIPVFTAPCRIVANYPDIAVEKFSKLVEMSDVVWISAMECLVAPRVKRLRRNIPVVTQVHDSGHLVCPCWTNLYGLRETCVEKCSPQRIIRCKQLTNEYLCKLGFLSRHRMRAYQLVDFAKGPIDFLRWPIKPGIVENIDGFLAVSKSTMDLVLCNFPELKATPFEVIPNPVLVPELGLDRKRSKGRPMILYASGPDLTKGPHIALHAVRQLIDGGLDDLTLTMLRVKGTPWIENLVENLNLKKFVELRPRLERYKVFELMVNSNLVLMPSVWPEGFGRIPVEANKLGTAAVVSNRGALPEVILDKITGLVAEPYIDPFAEATARALSMDWNRELMIQVTKARFNPDRIVADFVRFLQRFI